MSIGGEKCLAFSTFSEISMAHTMLPILESRGLYLPSSVILGMSLHLNKPLNFSVLIWEMGIITTTPWSYKYDIAG